MSIYNHPSRAHNGHSPLDGSIGRLLFMFKQLEPWQLEGIVAQVGRALPIPVQLANDEGETVLSRTDAAQRAVVQLLYMIAPQSYPDIFFALTYAEALAAMKGAEGDEVAMAH